MVDNLLTDIRPSPIAGRWYPSQRDQLATSVDQHIEQAAITEIPGEVIGLIAPHAGHLYSGSIAGHAFRLARGKTFKRVAVISPMHSFVDAPILTTGHQAYGTPLGPVAVDREFLDALGQRVELTPIRNDPEHSLEIELPFLQRALAGPFQLAPLMLRDQTYAGAEKLGKALAATIGEAGDTLLVASSDLSHFYPDAQARALDKKMLDRVEAFDPAGVIRLDDEGKAFACGRAAIATTLIAARELGATGAKVVGYGTSGDTSGDRSQVVGYGAAAIYIGQK